MEAMNGPQWKQLPMLMTPHEMAGTPSGDFDLKPMSKVADLLHNNWGHREDRDASMVEGIRHGIRKGGYDERFPIQMRMGGQSNNGNPFVWEGHHRAVAAMDENVLMPVVHHSDSRKASEERLRQQQRAWRA